MQTTKIPDLQIEEVSNLEFMIQNLYFYGPKNFNN